MSAATESLARLREGVAERRRENVDVARVASHLERLHHAGIESFDAHGWPSRRNERWKGTSLAPLEAVAFERVGPAETEATVDVEDGLDAVFVDGRLARIPDSSDSSGEATDLPEGMRILSLAELSRDEPELVQRYLGRLAPTKTDGLTGLQSALFEDVAVVHLPRGFASPRAIRILSIATSSPDAPSACFPRLLVVARSGASATIELTHRTEGEGPGLCMFVAEHFLAENAQVEIVELQLQNEGVQDRDEEKSRTHITQTFAQLDRDARFESHVLSLGGGLIRSELEVRLTDEGASTAMRGFFLGRGKGHVDHYTTVDHAAPHTESDEEYRGVLTDASKGVFRGRVIVRPDAQKTDARQSNPNLLLSDRAVIDTKPQLEIYADDVKASHGSTIGQLDPDSLFFLRARGIDEAEARLLLTRGFAGTIVDAIGDEAVRARVAEYVEAALASLTSPPQATAEEPA